MHDAESGASVAAMSVTDLLAHLPQMSPRLRELQLFLGPSTYAHGSLAQTLQGLQSLTEFRIISSTPLSPQGVMVLSSLPCLVTSLLDIRAADFPPHGMTERPGDSVNFPALRKLRLLVDTAECAATLLSWSVIDPPGLVELIVRVEVETNITPLQFASITATLPAKCCRITLETIVLHGASKSKCDHPSLVAYPPSAMAPLYSLSALRTAHILGDCYASLDDDALADMARAWPYIETLMLCPSRSFGEPHPMPAAVTLAGLRDVVEQCPHLQILYVALADAKRAVCEELLARRPPPACGDGTHEASQVFKLGIGTPSIEPQDVAAVAAVLTMIFPARDFWIYVPWSIFNDIGASPGCWWYKVDRASLAFQLVRQHEQKPALERARVARPALR